MKKMNLFLSMIALVSFAHLPAMADEAANTGVEAGQLTDQQAHDLDTATLNNATSEEARVIVVRRPPVRVVPVVPVRVVPVAPVATYPYTVCYAENSAGRTFYARGYNSGAYLESVALSTCESYSGYTCRFMGCN